MTSSSQSSPSLGGTVFAMMSMHKRDKLRFLHFPEDIYTAAESIITNSWPPGVQEQKMYGESYEYKLKGSPWGMMGHQEGVGSRILLRNMFAFLHRRGWVLVTPLSHSVRPGTKDSLIFKKKQGSPSPPPSVDWLVLAFMHTKKLRVIGDEPGVMKSLREAFEGMDVFESDEWTYDSFEFKFKYAPWRAHGEATVKARLLLLQIIEVMDGQGWVSYCACKQRTDSDDVKHPDTWYFVKKKHETIETAPEGEQSLINV